MRLIPNAVRAVAAAVLFAPIWAAVLFAPTWAAAQTQVGAIGAVNPRTTGQPPAAAAPRQLAISDEIVLDERIVAGEDGAAHVMFLDQTTVTIGPNSDILIDRYFYDPDEAAGEMALSMARGVLRFIGGRVSKANDATIAVGGAVIAVRGGMAVVDARNAASIGVVFLAGDYVRVTVDGRTLALSRPGASAVISTDEAGARLLRYAGVASGVELAGTLAGLRSPGDGGVRTTRPGDAAAQVRSAEALGAVNAAVVSTRGESRVADIVRLTPFETIDPALDVASVLTASAAGAMMGGVLDVGGEGALRAQLIWNTPVDLDLHLVLPNAAGEVFFRRRSITFGDGGAATATLDADNLGGVINAAPDLRVENIRVTGTPPGGDYAFFARGFRVGTDSGTADYTLNVLVDGAQADSQTGALATGQDGPNIVVRIPD